MPKADAVEGLRVNARRPEQGKQCGVESLLGEGATVSEVE